jgi:hypothetical protein
MQMIEDHFSASWDNLAKAATVGVCLLVGFVAVVLMLVVENFLLKAGFLALFGGILAIPILWAPRGYTIRSRTVLVKRLVGDAEIHVVEEPRIWNWTWWGIRLFGSGGLYGYFGYFAFRGLGRVFMHATNRRNLVLIKDVGGRKYLISPDNPQRLIQRLRM